MNARERGFSLVELLVALALLLLALAMFGSAFVVVQKTSTQQLERGWSTNQIRQALATLDSEVRGAYAIRRTSSGTQEQLTIYREKESERSCSAWRVTGAIGGLQELWRTSWRPGSPVPPWTLMAIGIRNSSAGGAPKVFSVKPFMTSGSAVLVSAEFWVDTTAGAFASGRTSRVVSTFTARNIRRYDTLIDIGGVVKAIRDACEEVP